MRILHVVQGYAPAIGGTEKVIQAISERLVTHYGDNVTVYTTVGYNCEIFWRTDQPSLPAGTTTIHGVTVRRFPVFNHLGLLRRVLAGGTYKLRLPFNDYFRAWYHGPIIPTMPREIAASGAEVIAASSFPLLHMYYALHGAMRACVPLVLIGGIHLGDAWGFDSPLIYRTIRQAHHAIAYTEFERDALVARGVPADQISVVGLGVEPAAFVNADGRKVRQQVGWEDEPVVAFVGQQVAHKGIDTLISAMTQVWPKVPHARLLIAGSQTTFTSVLEAQVSNLPSAWRERVTFVHNFDEASKPDLVAACDIMAYPSAYESFGLALLDAWAAGRPVIGCRDSAPGSIISHGQDGLLVTYRDQTELAQAIKTLLLAPEQCRQMGQAGQRKVLACYTWDIATRRFRSVYAQVRDEYAAQHRAGRSST